MRIVSPARIRGGMLSLKQNSRFVSDCAQLKDGENYIVTVERQKKKRSLAQNSYYHGVIVPIIKAGLIDVGYRMTTEATHEYLKGKFNITEVVNERTGEVLKAVGSTTEMSTSQIMDYFAEITQWAAEYLNVQIPQPGEQVTVDFNN